MVSLLHNEETNYENDERLRTIRHRFFTGTSINTSRSPIDTHRIEYTHMNLTKEDIAEGIARLSKTEIAELATIMVNKHIADDLDCLLLTEKAERMRRESSLAHILFADKD